MTSDQMRPSVAFDREVWVNDRSVAHTLAVTWLGRRLTVEWSRPFRRSEQRRVDAAYEAEMADIARRLGGGV